MSVKSYILTLASTFQLYHPADKSKQQSRHTRRFNSLTTASHGLRAFLLIYGNCYFSHWRRLAQIWRPAIKSTTHLYTSRLKEGLGWFANISDREVSSV